MTPGVMIANMTHIIIANEIISKEQKNSVYSLISLG